MQVINIDPVELNAVRQFAATADIRYCLNGVLVQASATQTRIVATDGHMLGLFDHVFENEGVEYVEFIVPLNALDSLKPNSKYGPVQVVIRDADFELRQIDSRVLFKPVEGKFPDYRRVIPTEVSGEAAQFNGDLLARIHKAQRMFDKKLSPIIWHGGEGSALIQLQEAGNFIGVIMPLCMTKPGEPKLTAPDTASFRAPVRQLKQAEKEASFLD